MIQHFESLSIDMPQPKYAIGTWVNDGKHWGTIAGLSYREINTHPTWEHEKGWYYLVAYVPGTSEWKVWDGESWVSEDEIFLPLNATA